jgi:hypothetical protein
VLLNLGSLYYFSRGYSSDCGFGMDLGRIWYCISNMSQEQITTPENDDFFKKAARRSAVVTGALLVGSVALVVGQNKQNEHRHDIAQEMEAAHQAQTVAYKNSIDAAVNARYDANDQVKGKIFVTQDSDLIGPAVSIVKSELGDAANAVMPTKYDSLNESAQLLNTQPGDVAVVVRTDLNPEANDGVEYLVVDEKNIILKQQATLPGPTIADGSSNEASN